MGKISEQYLEDAHMEKRAYIQQVLELKAEVAELKRQLETAVAADLSRTRKREQAQQAYDKKERERGGRN